LGQYTHAAEARSTIAAVPAPLDDAWLAALREQFRDGDAEGRPGAAPTAADALTALPPGLVEHIARAAAAGAKLAHAGELALAWAVGRGDAEALRRFDREILPEADAAARKIDRSPAFADEVRQAVRVRLVVGDGAEPRILAYRGTGPLRAWVAVAALRVALNAKRAARRAPGGGAADDDLLADVVDREPDPELRHLKTLYRAELREALTAALAQLADRPRALLRLRFVDGLELAHIGRLYRVHESTASRWVSQAVADVAADARRRLVERLAVAPSAADSVARMVASQLDLSIGRLLR
jgi:RNA polymerase sigma-70 factor (ECF subfamily)